MAATTNDDLARLIDRNHSDNQDRFVAIEDRLDFVEANVASIDAEMVSRSELDELMVAREGMIVNAIDQRMVYYGRRAIALIGTPVGLWLLNRIWESL